MTTPPLAVFVRRDKPDERVEYVRTEWDCCKGGNDEHYQIVYRFNGRLYRCMGSTFARDFETVK